jgi:integrase
VRSTAGAITALVGLLLIFPNLIAFLGSWADPIVKYMPSNAGESFVTSTRGPDNRLEQGTYIAPSKLTLRQFIEDEWLPAVKGRLRPGTFDSYAGNLRTHVLPQLGSRRLQQVTPGMLNALYGDLSERLSPSTIRYVDSITRQALAAAVEWDRLARNPADRARPPKPSRSKLTAKGVWTAEQLTAFLDHVRDDRLYAAWRFAAMTGVRRGELLGLTWPALDLEAARASITETLIGDRQSSTPKTERGRRSIALDAETVAALRAHRKHQIAEQLALGPAYEDHGLVVCREDGTAMWPRSFSRTFDRQAQGAGLPRIPLKKLEAYACHAVAQRRRSPEGRPGTTRARDDLDHARHLQPSDPGDATGRSRSRGRAARQVAT